LLLFSAGAAFGQLDDNTITITATRQVTLQPDQIVFNLGVQAAETAGLDDVLAQLPGTGISAANLGSVNGFLNMVAWDFTLKVPLTQASATTTLLAQLEQKSGGVVSFNVQGTQVSEALQQAQPCSQTALVADARSQAQTLAAAAGYTVGPVLAVSDGSGAQTPSSVPTYVYSNFIVGQFLAIEQNFVTGPPTACTAVVKFQLYSYH